MRSTHVISPVILPIQFPTPLHREMADLARDFFSSQDCADTVLVVNSCARGRAVPASDLDMAVLLSLTAPSQQIQVLTMKWQEFMATDQV